MQERLPDWALLAVCLGGFLVAGWYRSEQLVYAQIYSDSLSPFAAALKAQQTGWANPPNPEADHWSWLAALPLLWLAQNLTDLFVLRFWIGALVVPLAGLILWCLDVRYKLGALVLTSILLTVDSGLIDTLISAFRGYWAPEFFALATLGYVLFLQGKLWGAVLASVATIIAAGQHPLAFGCMFAIVWLWWKTYQRSSMYCGIAIFCTVLALLPRILWSAELLQCDAGGLACLQNIALSSSEEYSPLFLLWRVLHDRFWVEMGFGGGILLLGCLLNRKHPLATWVLLSTLGIVALGLSISTLRPYHFRVLAVPMLCWSVSGWMSKPRWLLLVTPIWLWGYIMQPPEIIPVRNTMRAHDALARELCQRQEPFWIDGYQPEEELEFSLQGIGIAMALQGCAELLVPTPGDSLLLLSSESLGYKEYCQSGKAIIYELKDSDDILGLQKEALLSGFDVATLFFPDEEIILRW